MKNEHRGPFSRIRWFCKDGPILPPEPYACETHGGGSQHGEWSEKTRALRENGYRVANFYADLDIDGFINQPDWYIDLSQMLIEQFLIKADDGWIFRKARFYRGAFQEEGERAGARRLLLTLVQDKTRLNERFLLLRNAAAFLSHGRDTGSIQTIRQVANTLSEKDPRFVQLRNKIHAYPEPKDVERVREYARQIEDENLKTELEDLAKRIEDIYNTSIVTELKKLHSKISAPEELANALIEAREYLDNSPESGLRFLATAKLLKAIRDNIVLVDNVNLRLELLDTSLTIESEHFVAASSLAASLPELSRHELLKLLHGSLLAIYGTGLISTRQLDAAEEALKNMDSDSITLAGYKGELNYLGLIPGWGTQTCSLYFSEGLNKLTEIEPQAHLFIQDIVRGSPLFFYARFINVLLLDADRFAGIQNHLFDKNVGTGLRALNPGLARGILQIAKKDADAFETNGIYLLPATVSDLPPIAGILTAGEGNPLSHVQLLARNLGIPNVSIDPKLMDMLKPYEGKPVVLAVSPGGTVQLSLEGEYIKPGENATALKERNELLMKADLDKLDLGFRDLLPLGALRAGDSGHIVGPKSAKLGELKHHFPDTVADGLVIPFAIFRDLLRQKFPGNDQTVFEWMVSNYRALDKLPPGSTVRIQKTEQFRQQLEEWLLNSNPDETFINTLRLKMEHQFGKDGSYGVFVRSDTNVEDLPGFTGAGLNLTVPNVVGFENVILALKRVWASPFTARAYAWRQALMQEPEHVYPAVLLMQGVNVDKSGVMVTQDIANGDRDRLSVAVNEGVGGAVDGQAAESLRISIHTGEVRLLSQASSPVRRQLNPEGGLITLPVHLNDYILQSNEIKQLIVLAQELPQRFPPITDSSGQAVAADIEFGFLNGKLRLFQIRPYLESKSARNNEFLRSLDPDETILESVTVDLNAAPEL